MNGDFLLDTNAVIDIRNKPSAFEWLQRQDTVAYVSVVTLGELYFGAKKSQRVSENTEIVDALSDRTLVLSLDSDTARQYAEIRYQLMRSGRPIPQNDVWIAAQARQYGLTLVTRDRHFDVVEGLQTTGW
jgi:tRNA(fMet)-specific endonuclease VapC